MIFKVSQTEHKSNALYLKNNHSRGLSITKRTVEKVTDPSFCEALSTLSEQAAKLLYLKTGKDRSPAQECEVYVKR